MSINDVNETCPELNVSFGFDTYQFQHSDVTRRIHNNAIRFGNTKNFSVLYSDNTTTEQQKEYIWGAVSTAIFIFSVVLLWFMIIITFRFLGPKRVGMFSGKQAKVHPTIQKSSNKHSSTALIDNNHTVQPAEVDTPIFDDNPKHSATNAISTESYHDTQIDIPTEQEIEAMFQKQRKHMNRARIAVLICSCGIIMSVILFLSIGIKNLKGSHNDVVNGLIMGQELCVEGISLIDNFVRRQNSTFESLSNVTIDLNQICPLVTDEICSNISNVQSCNFTGIPVSDEFQETFTFLVGSLRDFVFTRIYDLRDDLVDLNEELEYITNKVQSFNWAYIIASIFAVLILLFNLGITYGIFAVWYQEKSTKQSCISKFLGIIRHWLMVPIFVFLVIMSWIFSMVFVIGTVTTSDLCYNSPDDAVLAILQEDGLPIDSTIRRLLSFYVDGCPIDEAPVELSDRVYSIRMYFETAATLVGELDTIAEDFFVQNCGTDPVIISNAVTAVQETICNVGLTLYEAVIFFSCDNWRPLYRTIAYDALCFNGNDGLYYVTITQLCIVIFAMIMVTLRAAFKPGEGENEERLIKESLLLSQAAALGPTVQGNDIEPTNLTTQPSLPKLPIVNDDGVVESSNYDKECFQSN